DGLRVAATRQNAGRVLALLAPRPPPRAPGSVKPPAATLSAVVIVASGSLSDASASHEPAAASGATVHQQTASEPPATTENTPMSRAMRRFIISLLVLVSGPSTARAPTSSCCRASACSACFARTAPSGTAGPRRWPSG